MDNMTSKLVLQLQEQLSLTENTITLYNSVADAIDAVAKISLSAGGEALIAGPTFSNISEAAMQYADSVTLHLGSSAFAADCPGLLDVITDKTKLVFLGAPNDPTGAVYSEKEVRKIIERAYNAQVIIDETQLVMSTCSFAQFAQEQSRLIVIKSSREPGDSCATYCGYIVANASTIALMTDDSENRIDASALTQALETLANYCSQDERIREITENKTLVAMRLRSMGIEVRDTLSDKLMIEVTEPLEVQLALEQAGVDSRNCIGLPQLANWLVVLITDDKSARLIIDTFETIPARYYQEISRESQEEHTVGEGTYSQSTLTIKRGAESAPMVAKRTVAIAAQDSRITNDTKSNINEPRNILGSKEKTI